MFNQLWQPEEDKTTRQTKQRFMYSATQVVRISRQEKVREGSVTAPKQLSEGNYLLHCTADQTGQRINKRSMKY